MHLTSSDALLNCVQIKVLLMAVKDFDPENGDPSYTMSIIDLLLECVELSYRHGMHPLILTSMMDIFLYQTSADFMLSKGSSDLERHGFNALYRLFASSFISI